MRQDARIRGEISQVITGDKSQRLGEKNCCFVKDRGVIRIPSLRSAQNPFATVIE
jgi:hypothetical protein